MSDGWGWLGLDAPVEELLAKAEEEAMDEDCYTDEVGGHHDSGIGWAPNGHWCGECIKSSCSKCPVWKAIKTEIASELNKRGFHMKYFEVIFRTNYCGSDESHYIKANNEKEVNDWAEECLPEFINDNEDDAIPDYECRMEEEGIPEDEWNFYESAEYENYKCDCGYDITEIPEDEKDDYASEWEDIN